MYPGINGNTHGDKKLINPAPIAIKYSVIINYFSETIFDFCSPK